MFMNREDLILKVIKFRKHIDALPFIDIDENITSKANEFFEYASNLENALGLAAPQVGLDTRMCAIRSSKGWVYAINPNILETKGNPFITEEGCLTWPSYYVVAKRFSNVQVSFYNFESKQTEINWYSGLDAIIWQHEIDHLTGVEEKLIKTDKSFPKEKLKISRNDICVCGSGLKHKKCCASIVAKLDVISRDMSFLSEIPYEAIPIISQV